MGGMQPKSDAQLLREYAEHSAEGPFAELVVRHTNLVYSAALRQVESPDSAAEVTQQVFIGLAQSARTLSEKLAENASLVGWLCRSARNLSLNLRRDEFRRHSRERQAMAHLDSTDNPTPDWTLLRPALDAAMSELSEVDYDAIVLRYFKNQDLRMVGQALGVTDDTAQKRVSRALQKLHDLLSRRGITTSATALSLALSANAVQAAPSGLAATISTASAALVGTAVDTSVAVAATKTIAMTTLQKTLVTAVIAATITTTIYEARQAAIWRDRSQALHEQTGAQIQKLTDERDEAMRRLATSGAETSQVSNTAELLRLRGEMARLRALESDAAKLREELLPEREQNRLGKAAQAATHEAAEKFQAQRAFTVNGMKQVGLKLRGLGAQNNLNAAFTADGKLNPALIAASNPDFDLRNVELLVSNPAQLEKLLDEAPETIVARTAEPISTPDGRWLRFYTMADGSVQQYSTEKANEAFTGTWHLGPVTPRP